MKPIKQPNQQQIKIQKNIPIPMYKKAVFPIDEMEVGDSFFC